MKWDIIKHLSVFFKVTSGWCDGCKKYRYHKIEETKEAEIDKIITTQKIVCIRCGKQNAKKILASKK